MKHLKKLVVIAVVCLLVGGIGSAVAYSYYEPSTLEESVEITNEDIISFDIRVNNEAVKMVPSTDDSIRVELTGNAVNKNENNLMVEESGATLLIETENEKRKLFSLNFFDFNRTLTIYVPEREYQSLQAEIDNGSIRVKEMNAKNILTTTKNGKIFLHNIISDQVEVNTNNGKIELENVEGKLIGKTNNGAISLVSKELDRQIDFQTDNGSITIETEKEPTNVVFDTKTNNGSINLFNDSSYDMIIGDGDHTIKLRTKNGSITVNK
ncbi:DUF4097 family beta strand repeat-containing protein [Gracilibacillus massiliensis]|uniref:DUF4097 family beta strand repeat-containing protein n=1 Tax=Gracilibacillus massiliensis TaxID=1564956 RepID=UPI00071D88C9|nr:DUF4097 family beta strand repeat-containing protein [Gracilibacillus massiliensis]